MSQIVARKVLKGAVKFCRVVLFQKVVLQRFSQATEGYVSWSKFSCNWCLYHRTILRESSARFPWFCSAKLGDWFKNIAPHSQPIKCNDKTNLTSSVSSRALRRLQTFTLRYDWFISKPPCDWSRECQMKTALIFSFIPEVYRCANIFHCSNQISKTVS